MLCCVGGEWSRKDGGLKHPRSAVYEVGEGRDQVSGGEDTEGTCLVGEIWEGEEEDEWREGEENGWREGRGRGWKEDG